jgi:hypothetical protein
MFMSGWADPQNGWIFITIDHERHILKKIIHKKLHGSFPSLFWHQHLSFYNSKMS